MNKQHRKSLFYDKLSRVVIYFGGIATIISVIAILIFIFSEALPLWFGADSEKSLEINYDDFSKSNVPILIGIDEYKEIIYAVTDSGRIDFLNLEQDSIIKSISLEQIKSEKVTAFSKTLANNFIALGTDKGKAVLFQIDFKSEFMENGLRTINPVFRFIDLIQLDSLENSISHISFRLKDSESYTVIAVNSDNNLLQYSYNKKSDFTGEEQVKIFRSRLDQFIDTKITSVELDNFCEKLMVGTSDGQLLYLSIKDEDNPQLIQTIKPFGDEQAAITKLGFVIGDQSVIVANSNGKLASYMRILDEKTDYGWKLVNPHTFKSHNNSINSFSASSRNKTFITGDVKGYSYLHHLTSERTLLEFVGDSAGIKDISYAPKGDAVVLLYNNSRIALFEIDNPHPETSFKTLFGKVWYEGYSQPAFVWQSTGGTDDFEPKFSLIPLIIGTLKGTLYAMLFAIPLALMGALYTSQFSHPSIKNVIKPTVEIMAALPSVVIGFIAGLWLAPLLEKIFVGVMLIFIIVPIMIYIGLQLWNKLPTKILAKLKAGTELIFIILLIIIGFFISQWLGPIVEIYLLGGDYRIWISEFFNQQYDQRNSIVVGFAMGFAVIPIIFTICEDALSSVPSSLTSASLALGATKWQTATRIVLPTASPGIFSAVMIGFGRAVGETMIVLMATGNTPILSFSPFNGMRTLSANIAVEIPEAPYGGTLYRVLFLAATLLFIFTFIINTVAEIVRQRLRKKYAEL